MYKYKCILNSWNNLIKYMPNFNTHPIRYSSKTVKIVNDGIINPFRYKYPKEVEIKINQQINDELQASHIYLQMSAHLARSDVALFGCAGLFLEFSNEEREHAQIFIRYQNLRGGQTNIVFSKEFVNFEMCSLNTIFCQALKLEINVTDKIYDINRVAIEKDDQCTSDFLITNFFYEQMDSIRRLGSFLTRLNRIADSGLAAHIIDQELLLKYPYKQEIV